MPTIIPDAPWPANLALLMLAVILPVYAAHLSNRRQLDDIKMKQAQQAKALREVHETTVNTHPTILRDDIDHIEAKVDSLVAAVEHIQRDQARSTTYIADVDTSVRALQNSLERRDTLQTDALAGAVETRKREMRNAISRALDEHVFECHLHAETRQDEGN